MLIAERILLFAVTKYKIFNMKYMYVYEQLKVGYIRGSILRLLVRKLLETCYQNLLST
jgi:hypothetical protein